MSSTPVLERTSTQAEVEWIAVEAPIQRRMPSSARLVEAIAHTKQAIVARTDNSITVDTDNITEPDEDAVAFARYSADVWDD